MLIHIIIILGIEAILFLKPTGLPQELLVWRVRLTLSYIAIAMYLLMRTVVLLQMVVPKRKSRKFGVRQN